MKSSSGVKNFLDKMLYGHILSRLKIFFKLDSKIELRTTPCRVDRLVTH